MHIFFIYKKTRSRGRWQSRGTGIDFSGTKPTSLHATFVHFFCFFYSLHTKLTFNKSFDISNRGNSIFVQQIIGYSIYFIWFFFVKRDFNINSFYFYFFPLLKHSLKKFPGFFKTSFIIIFYLFKITAFRMPITRRWYIIQYMAIIQAQCISRSPV